MAFALTTSLTAGLGASGGTTGTFDSTGAKLIVVGVSYYNGGGGAPSSISDNKGNTYIPTTLRAAVNVAHRFYYVLNPTVGTGHTVTISGSNFYPGVVIQAFSGNGTFDVQNGAGFNGPTPPQSAGSITPTANNSLVVTGFASDNVASPTTSGFTVTTQAYGAGVNMTGASGYVVQTTATAVNPSWSWSTAPAGVKDVALSVISFTVAATIPTRVQTTAKLQRSNTNTATITFAGAQPTVGNAIVIPIIGWNSGSISATDNYGNTYNLARQTNNGSVNVHALYCGRVNASGSGFTINVLSSVNQYWILCAIEVTNIGTGLTANQTAVATGNSTAPSVTTPTLLSTSTDAFLLGVMGCGGGQSSITVAGGWTQEVEELPFSIVPGEADSKSITGAVGTTETVSWTLASSATWATAIVVFVPAFVSAEERVSQDVVEIVALPGTTGRVSQDVVEAITLPPSSAQLTQGVVEVLSLPAIESRVTQQIVETLSVPLAPVRVTQLVVEVLFPTPPSGVVNSVWLGERVGNIWVE